MKGEKKKVGGNSDLVGSSGLSDGLQRFAPRNQPLRRRRAGQRPCGRPDLAGAGSQSDQVSVVCPVGYGLGGAVRLAEHLVPRRKLLLKTDPFSALSRVFGPDSSLYSASCGHSWSPPQGIKRLMRAGPSLRVGLKVSGGSQLVRSRR